MIKFIIISLIIISLLFGAYYAVYQEGVYFNKIHSGQMSIPFKSDGKDIKIRNLNGEYERIILRGVDVLSSIPGKYGTDFAAEEDDYLRWIKNIGEMGANSIRVVTIMDDDFYNALYRYNMSNKSPIYLLQGIPVSDEVNYGDGDAYREDFADKLIQDGLDAVDIIHGRKIISGMRGIKRYRVDVSSWVIGYLVGSEWDGDMIAYTDHSTVNPDNYNGDYFYTAEGSTSFEAVLARVMDRIISYEADKYNAQRIIGFINDPLTDFLIYENVYRRQLRKYSYIDAEHIIGTEKLKSGQFASYRLYDTVMEFSQYLSEDQREEISDILSSLNISAYYDGYLQLMAEYHTMPVVAAGYGFSSSRGITEPGSIPITEDEQGKKLVAVYREAIEEGWSGVFISSWQDAWERRSWNTAFSTIYRRGNLWHDVQSEGQGYGLMSFDPGESERIAIIDGNPEEWSEDDIVLESEGTRLSIRSDEQGLYLLIQGEIVKQDNKLYIPMDTTQKSGSRIYEDLSLEFDREADFILSLDGIENSRLLVHERYDGVRANFNQQITGSDPYIFYPDVDSPVFLTSYMVIDNNNLIEDFNILTPEERRRLTALGIWETGHLTYGINDPDSESYNSLADFYFGDNCVEVRLPWILLNVGDPSDMTIHSDYYENYGVDFHHISKMWIGITDGSGTADMESFSMKKLGDSPEYHERLKKSYYIVQQEWKRSDMYGENR